MPAVPEQRALVARRESLPQTQKAQRAAQYVRMSTDYQKYSIENQAVVIAAYAQLHGLSIVSTYRDEGESGLLIKNRMGLTQLIADVSSDQIDFGNILVFDVSRWGRFQDVDESAHYEFICKKAGVKVAYCAEQFDNDGSLLSNILKNIKRVMAAEYSRELSAKVFAGTSRLAKIGFKMGGSAGFGLERCLVDDHAQLKGVLKPGERKCLAADRVKLRPGPTEQIAIIKRIFDDFVGGKSQWSIAKELNREGVATHNGRLWSNKLVGAILKNEAFIGNYVYNRSTEKLGTKRRHNPKEQWIRSEGCITPIIDKAAFTRANKIMDEWHVEISEDEMLRRVRKVLLKKGKLSAKIINQAPTLPHSNTYYKHFGSLQNLYRLIDYRENNKHWTDLTAHQQWLDMNIGHAVQLRELLEKAGASVTIESSSDSLLVDEIVHVHFGLAKWRNYDGKVRWSMRHRVRWHSGWIAAIRMGENNASILDYLLLRVPPPGGPHLWLSEETLRARKIEPFKTFSALAKSLIRRVCR
ncbi:recombinase family protein [Bradyrhizobium sp. NDS-1]|uniref:recombinase family protein n=1 Tax=Bradyrhizobium sp. NDS-1 TaxID=3080014 RepID=UPI00293F5A60|nr:recombinase family protein [Bradyrhizobium sp. NDS-1]WOH76449.1 recombinase family protein [Bradyrhizobium sp. NDS-1]